MTTLIQAREVVYQRFVDNYTSTPFTFEGEDYTPPSPAWVRLSVRANTAGGQDTLGRAGNRRFRRNGIIAAQVFTPINQGLRQGDDLAQAIREIFEAQSFNGLDTTDGLIRESPPEDEWFIHIVEVFFDYDEVK